MAPKEITPLNAIEQIRLQRFQDSLMKLQSVAVEVEMFPNILEPVQIENLSEEQVMQHVNFVIDVLVKLNGSVNKAIRLAKEKYANLNTSDQPKAS
jgi:hypothetical protein